MQISEFRYLHFFLVIPRGFEPRTHSLEGCCSIQLSYETNLICATSHETNNEVCKSRLMVALRICDCKINKLF